MIILSPYRKIKPIAALVIVVAVILFLGWTVFCYWKNYHPKKNIQVEKKGGINEQLSEKEALQKLAEIIQSNDLSRCNEINDPEIRTACVNNISLNLARNKKDVRYCQKIDNKMIPIADCEREIALYQAMEKKDISICQLATDQQVREQCQKDFYPSLALFSKDINICSSIRNSQDFDYCHNNYLVNEKFRKDTKDFDCFQLKGGEIQEDCKKMQGMIGTVNVMSKYPNQQRCSQFKTSIFNHYCLSFL